MALRAPYSRHWATSVSKELSVENMLSGPASSPCSSRTSTFRLRIESPMNSGGMPVPGFRPIRSKTTQRQAQETLCGVTALLDTRRLSRSSAGDRRMAAHSHVVRISPRTPRETSPPASRINLIVHCEPSQQTESPILKA